MVDQPQRVIRGGKPAVGLPADGKPGNNSKQEYPNKNTKQDTTETVESEKIYRKFAHLQLSQKEFDILISE
jgi:hypothetical protein